MVLKSVKEFEESTKKLWKDLLLHGFVEESIEPTLHLKLHEIAKRLNKPQCIKLNAEQTKSKEE